MSGTRLDFDNGIFQERVKSLGGRRFGLVAAHTLELDAQT